MPQKCYILVLWNWVISVYLLQWLSILSVCVRSQVQALLGLNFGILWIKPYLCSVDFYLIIGRVILEWACWFSGWVECWCDGGLVFESLRVHYFCSFVRRVWVGLKIWVVGCSGLVEWFGGLDGYQNIWVSSHSQEVSLPNFHSLLLPNFLLFLSYYYFLFLKSPCIPIFRSSFRVLVSTISVLLFLERWIVVYWVSIGV